MPYRPLLPRRLVVVAWTVPLLIAASVWWAERTLGTGFLPHGYCIAWIPGLLWLHVASDSLIALAYLSIPLTLLHFVRRRRDLPFSWLFVLFGAFIVACGSTHMLDVWTLWNPDYWLAGSVKAITAGVSVSTAVALVWAMPSALAIPSNAQLRDAKEALEREVRMRIEAEAELRLAQAELERRVVERTAALDEANALLDAIFVAAPVGLAVVDEQDRYLRVNPALAGQSGVPVEAHRGRTVAEVAPSVARTVAPHVAAVRATGRPVTGLELDGISPATGQAAHGRMSFFPVAASGGRTLVGAVSEDITERRAADLERVRLLREAEEANRLKDEFMARVSHELRTPLQSMLSWVTVMRSKGIDADTASRALDRIERNVRLQARMISDLLDVARMLSGKLGIETAPLDPAPTVLRSVEAMLPAARERSVTLEVDAPTEGGLLISDAERLEQVVNNLVGNAVKFTLPGGAVRVRAQWGADEWRLVVTDTGIGLDEGELATLFEPFRQGARGAGAQRQGLGLGLAISRSIVALLGGRIEARSAGPGEGAEFSVRLPRARVAALPAGAAPAHALQLAGTHVLLVEDEPDVAEAMARLLRDAGATVDVCAGLPAVEALLPAGRWQVLLSDLRLEGGATGHAVLARLRQEDPALPAIAISAYGAQADIDASLAAGFARHLTKPVDAATVAAAILAVVGPRG